MSNIAPDLSVIIVVYNDLEHLRRCLPSTLQKTQNVSIEIVVVNDVSGDETENWLAAAYPDVKVISNPTRVGIGRSRNQGLAVANGRYVLLLDSDTELITSALDQMVRFMDEHQDIGICGCKMLYPSGEVQSTSRTFTYPHIALFRRTFLGKLFPNVPFLRNYLKVGWDHDSIYEPDYVAGACLMLRREVINHVGLLKNYTFGPEDQEICYRARRHGWRVVYYPQARIYHYYQRLTARGGINRKLLMQIWEMLDFYVEIMRDRLADLLSLIH